MTTSALTEAPPTAAPEEHRKRRVLLKLSGEVFGGGRIGVDECLHTARCLGADATLAKPFGHLELLAEVNGLLG